MLFLLEFYLLYLISALILKLTFSFFFEKFSKNSVKLFGLFWLLFEVFKSFYFACRLKGMYPLRIDILFEFIDDRGIFLFLFLYILYYYKILK